MADPKDREPNIPRSTDEEHKDVGRTSTQGSPRPKVEEPGEKDTEPAEGRRDAER
jgi:hypothetical protein